MLTSCGNCGVAPGEFHANGCSVERCCLCGFQAISCNCVYEVNGIDPDQLEDDYPDVFKNGPNEAMCARRDEEERKFGGRLPWTGEYPDCHACREFGLWCRWADPATGETVDDNSPGEYVRCNREDAGATENLGRLRWVAKWDKVLRNWVRC